MLHLWRVTLMSWLTGTLNALLLFCGWICDIIVIITFHSATYRIVYELNTRDCCLHYYNKLADDLAIGGWSRVHMRLAAKNWAMKNWAMKNHRPAQKQQTLEMYRTSILWSHSSHVSILCTGALCFRLMLMPTMRTKWGFCHIFFY